MALKFKIKKEPNEDINFLKKDKKIKDKSFLENPKDISKANHYSTGRFRNIRHGLKEEGNPSKLKQDFKNIVTPSEDGKKEKIKIKEVFESDNSYLHIGILEDGKKVIHSGRKNDYEDNLNTYKNRKIYLRKAYSYFRRKYETVTEEVDNAFCHFLSKNDKPNRFMKYLEDASRDYKTEDITKVFPFLNIQESINELNKLKNDRKEIKERFKNDNEILNNKLKSINNKIDRTNNEIYYNQLKKAKFKKQIKNVLTSNSDLGEESDEFWLIIQLRKLSEYLEKNGKEEMVKKENKSIK